MQNILILLLLMGLGIGCKNTTEEVKSSVTNEKDTLIVLDMDYPISNNDTIKLSSISDSLIYILLETKESFKVNRITKIQLTNSFLFVQCASHLNQFDREGNFIRRIGEKESVDVYGFDIQEREKKIFIAYGSRIFCYDFDGILVKEIPLSKELKGIGNFFTAIDSDRIAISLRNIGTNTNRLVIINNNGKIVKQFHNIEQFVPPKKALISNASRFYRRIFRFNEQIRYHPLYNDTLFSLHADSIKPVLVEKKIFKVPLKHRLEYSRDFKMFKKYCKDNLASITRMYESDRYIQITSNLGHVDKTLPTYWLYDKNTGKLMKYEQKLDLDANSIHIGYYNDWDGGLALDPEFIDNGYMIGWYSAKRFIKLNREGYKLRVGDFKNETSPTKNYSARSNVYSSIEQKEKLDQLLKKIEEEDNPVLMMVKLKK